MGRSKNKKKTSEAQIFSMRQILSSATQYLNKNKIKLCQDNYFLLDEKNNILQSCLLGGVILTFYFDKSKNLDFLNKPNIAHFEAARSILNCSKYKLRMIIMGFDESFNFQKPRLKNECYNLGFEFGNKKK